MNWYKDYIKDTNDYSDDYIKKYTSDIEGLAEITYSLLKSILYDEVTNPKYHDNLIDGILLVYSQHFFEPTPIHVLDEWLHDTTTKYTIEDVKGFKSIKDIVNSFSKGNHYQQTYSIMGIGKTVGLSSHDCAELIMSYNIGGEYSNYSDLVKKADRYDNR